MSYAHVGYTVDMKSKQKGRNLGQKERTHGQIREKFFILT